ncbi:MAG: myo-inosose-2 dehydratase [Bacteroidetes bacterium]|nr:myo-inosose-2 dehydratase [Bacteroidota bacterium]
MFDSTKVKLGIAPLTWTNDDIPELGGDIPFEQCVSEMALAGFTGCEVGNKFPKDPTELKAALELRGLQVCNAWFSPYLTTKSFEENKAAFIEHCTFLNAMGAVVVGGGEQGHSPQGDITASVWGKKAQYTEDEWKKLTRGLNELGKISLEEFGIQFCYHHHMGTGVQTMKETDRLLHETKPEYVALNYDSGHFFFSFEDPVAALKKYVGRTKHVHLKDVRAGERERCRDNDMSFMNAVGSGVFTVPGDGILDFPTIFSVLEENNYEGWMVVEAEQDPAKAHPLTYAKMARDYIREQTGL